MKKLTVLALSTMLLCCIPVMSAEILICKDGKSLQTVRDPKKSDGQHYVKLTEAEWDAMNPTIPMTLKLYGVVRIADAGTDPSVQSIKDIVTRARQGDFDCIRLEDTTRDDACTSFSQLVTRVATPVCGPVLDMGEPVGAFIEDGLTSGRAACRHPGGEVKMSVECQ